jgi:hypothetical protein
MGLAHRAITPLPSRHHLGPLLAMCPSTSPQPEAVVYPPRPLSIKLNECLEAGEIVSVASTNALCYEC